jgi:putative ABC transport system ATP-binding protein
MTLLRARALHRRFDGGRIHALRGVDLDVDAGEFVSIEGPSGCGKTTLLQILGALDAPSSGEVTFRGEPLPSGAAAWHYRARTVGFVFQSSHLLPTLTAVENVEAPMFEMPWRARERRARARAMLEQVGFASRPADFPRMLSAGERQRVAIARSLANDPDILLADEPTGSLDSANAGRILELLRDIQRRRGLTLVVVTHDASVASVSDRRIHMIDGRVDAAAGPRAAV